MLSFFMDLIDFSDFFYMNAHSEMIFSYCTELDWQNNHTVVHLYTVNSGRNHDFKCNKPFQNMYILQFINFYIEFNFINQYGPVV